MAAELGSKLKASLLDNHGVPGDWVTGHRILDVLLLPIAFAVGFPTLRVLLNKFMFQVGWVGCRQIMQFAAVRWQL